MALIEWTNDLKLDIVTIDNQHKRLVEMLNEFYSLIKKKSNDELISKLLTEMKQYTIVHFRTEERYFEQYGYEHLAEHRKEHQKFIDKVTDLEERFKANQLILSFEITSFLKNWLIHHIKGVDVKYIKLFKEQGVN